MFCCRYPKKRLVPTSYSKQKRLFNKIYGDLLETREEIQVYGIVRFEGVRETKIHKLFSEHAEESKKGLDLSFGPAPEKPPEACIKLIDHGEGPCAL